MAGNTPYIAFNPRLMDRPDGRQPDYRYILLACGDPRTPNGACYRYGSHSYTDHEAAKEAARALTDTYRPHWGEGAVFLACEESSANSLIARHWRYDPDKPAPQR